MIDEIVISELSDEDVERFFEKLLPIFQKVLSDISNGKEVFSKHLNDNPPKIKKLTPISVLTSLLKKIAKNTLISSLTGIETMYLDSDTSPLTDKFEFYMKQKLPALVYTSICRLEEETIKFIDSIQNSNIDVKRSMLEKIYSLYLDVRGVDYGSGRNYPNGDKREYGGLLSIFYKNVTGNEDLYSLVRATFKRGVSVPPEYDFYKDVKIVVSDLRLKYKMNRPAMKGQR